MHFKLIKSQEDASVKPPKKARKGKLSAVELATATTEPADNSVKDPVLKESIEKRLVLRNMCSLKVANLPKHFNYATIVELAPDMAACRMQFDPVSRKPKGHVYIEFTSKDVASKYLPRLSGKDYNGKKLSVTSGGDLSESVGMFFTFFVNDCSLR